VGYNGQLRFASEMGLPWAFLGVPVRSHVPLASN